MGTASDMTQPNDTRVDWTEEFPHLPGAPIVEAVIHWQAHAKTDLQPEALKASLQARVADYPEVTDIRRLAFRVKVGEGKSTQEHEDDWDGLRLTSKDGRYVAQLMREGFALSRLQPYEDWGSFSAEALRMWGVFKEIAKPMKVTRLGVRFINRINLPQVPTMDSVLRNPPKRLKSLGLPISSFLYQSTHDVPAYPYQVKVVDTIQSTESGPALIVDIDAFTTREFGLDEDDVLAERLEHLRWLKNKAFFSLLTQEAIDGFIKEPA